MRFLEYLTEAGIVLGGKAYPKFNNIVILAGGSASGKGFIVDNALLIDGKVYDVDNLKGLVANASEFNDAFLDFFRYDYVRKGNKLDKRIDEILEFNLTPGDLNLKDSVDTSILHVFVSSKNYDNKLKRNMFMQAAQSDRKPNVVFDVTLRNTDILDVIYEFALLGGYDFRNIHLVWVLNSVEKAYELNRKRSRSVSDDIVLSTHVGVSRTMKTILSDFNTTLQNGTRVSDLIQGDVWIVPNLEGVDSKMNDSDQGNSAFEWLTKLQVKEAGKPIMPWPEIEKKYFRNGVGLLQKINSYVPDGAKW